MPCCGEARILAAMPCGRPPSCSNPNEYRRFQHQLHRLLYTGSRMPRHSEDESKTHRVFSARCVGSRPRGLEPRASRPAPTLPALGIKDDMNSLRKDGKALRDIPTIRTPASPIRRALAAPASLTCDMTPTSRNLRRCLPADPHIPWNVKLWKGPKLKWAIGTLPMVGGLIGLVLPICGSVRKPQEDEDVIRGGKS